MATIKSYTDINQSKKLAEILPLESADMCWTKYIDDGEVTSFHATINYGIVPIEYHCWSLAALLSVLPDTITNNDGIAFMLNVKKNIIEYSNPSLYLIYKSVKADNPVDACYEMILKLHELNLL